MTTKRARSVPDSQFWQSYSMIRYAILFYALIFTMLVLPVAALIGIPQPLIKILLGGTLLAAVMPNASRSSRYLILALVLLLVTARLSADAISPLASGLVQTAVALIGLLAAAAAMRFVIKADYVDSEAIYAALSTYLLAGIFFGQLYFAIEHFAPGSLSSPEPLTDDGAIYFSFVTLASLGYGDILPKSELTRGIAIFEVVGGQLFLAVMVARLIGAFAIEKPKA